MTTRADATITPMVQPGTNLAPLVADFYAQAPEPVRVSLLRTMLRPVGPLALVAIAAGAFARLLPPSRWHGAEVTPEEAKRVDSGQVLELARYVEQKSPELLMQLPDLVGDPRIWLATTAGVVLLVALQRLRRSG